MCASWQKVQLKVACFALKFTVPFGSLIVPTAQSAPPSASCEEIGDQTGQRKSALPLPAHEDHQPPSRTLL